MFALLSAFWALTFFPSSVGLALGIMAVVAVMVGALTPDIDQPTANIWRKMIGGNVVGNFFRAFSGGHRHFTHSLVGIGGIGWLLHWVVMNLVNPHYEGQAWMIWSAFMIGYVSHVVVDTFTDRGVPWLWPLPIHVKLPPGPEEVRVTTDSFVERVMVRSGIVVLAVILLQANWSLFKAFFQ